ncbi:MAG: hypothetical protein ACI945_000061 [Pseudohongiellaceae bacterium]|jgi:hypothetical protein|tara:strand:- start:311 stop:427 length:117 start_codon:yes stop_codon:yes gene_type:complete
MITVFSSNLAIDLNLEILIGGAASRVREKRSNIIVWSI